MAILARIIRLFKADIHGVMDQIEDQGLLLKQHLRDMEDSLVQRSGPTGVSKGKKGDRQPGVGSGSCN
jgi:hypothetical protein